MIDLWPTQISALSVAAPSAILREQATALGRKTRNVVEARVHAIEEAAQDKLSRKFGLQDDVKMREFNYVFELIAPILNYYEYPILTISHDVTLYPVYIVADGFGEIIKARNEEEFIEKLSVIFNHKKVLQVVQSLISQSVTSEMVPF